MKPAFEFAALLALSSATSAAAHEAAQAALPGAKNAKITQVYEHALPGMPGKSMKGVLVEYGPGGYSPSHRHAKSAIIYATVLEGSVRSQVNGGQVKTFRKGENWTEMPGDHHGVSANASDTMPAKVLAVFVVDDADAVLTIPDK
jgi:quercetin dioxygenase-like cupin family protein